MKKVLLMAFGVMFMATQTLAYQGDWTYNNNPGGSEVLLLDDWYNGRTRVLRGTGGWCGKKGSSYATMRQTLRGAPNGVDWWVTHDCGDIVRVCVRSDSGRKSCSSYRDWGWDYY